MSLQSFACPLHVARRLAPGAFALVALLALVARPASAQIVFEPPLAFDGGALAGRVLIGDVNEDGLPDAITAHQNFIVQPAPVLSLGIGGGAFGAPQNLALGGAGFNARRLADFNADGHLDLLTFGGQTPPLNVAVLPGMGDGTFGAPVGINSNHQGPADADAGDFNADGALDVVIVNGMFGFSSGAIVAVLGNGDGTFGAPATVVPFFSPQGGRVRTGDFNADGLHDFAFTGSTTNSVRLSLGDGTFVAPPCGGCTLITESDFAVADLNLDGRDDVLTPLRSLLATPDGSLGAVQSLPAALTPVSVDAGDLDGDGVPDAVIGRNVSSNLFDPNLTVGDVLVLRGNGNGTFGTPGLFGTAGLVVSKVPQPRGVTVADVDLDGRPDAAVASFQFSNTTLRVLLNHTYAPGSAFLDLGGVLAGSNGAPIQLADGTLVAGEPFEFQLANGPAGGAAYHVVGLSQLNAPFKGGVMIPSVNLVNGPLPLDASGGITLAGPWPGGAEGLSLYLQFWMPAAGGPQGFAASSGVRASVP